MRDCKHEKLTRMNVSGRMPYACDECHKYFEFDGDRSSNLLKEYNYKMLDASVKLLAFLEGHMTTDGFISQAVDIAEGILLEVEKRN